MRLGQRTIGALDHRVPRVRGLRLLFVNAALRRRAIDQAHTLATLIKDNDELRATKGKDGTWSYRSQTSTEHGDILDFEIHRGARNVANAREEVRPELDRVEKDRGRLDPQPE